MKNKEHKDNIITINRKARHDYNVVETFEAGISLVGSEVKSCVAKEVSISEAYCVVRNGEVIMVQSMIAQYANSSYMNHDKNRERRLLLHKRQIRKLKSEVEKKGMTIIPLDMHVADNGRIKLTIGLCKGKNAVDKRETMRRRDTERETRDLKKR